MKKMTVVIVAVVMAASVGCAKETPKIEPPKMKMTTPILRPLWLQATKHPSFQPSKYNNPKSVAAPETMPAITFLVKYPTVTVTAAAAKRAGSGCPSVALGQITSGVTSAGKIATAV